MSTFEPSRTCHWARPIPTASGQFLFPRMAFVIWFSLRPWLHGPFPITRAQTPTIAPLRSHFQEVEMGLRFLSLVIG